MTRHAIASTKMAKHSTTSKLRTVLALAVAGVGLLAAQGYASTNTWQGATGGDGSWDTGGNWTSTLAPLTSDDVILPTSTAGLFTAIALGTDVANSLTFNNSYTLTGGTLALTSGNITLAAGVIDTINSQLIDPTVATGLTIGGGNSSSILNLGANETVTGLLTISTAGTVNASGIFNYLTGVQVSSGKLVLSGVNTFTGNSTISGGTLQINSASSLGNAANTVALSNGGILLVSANMTGGRSISLGTGDGTISVNAGKYYISNDTLTGANSLTKAGGGTLFLNNTANTFGAAAKTVTVTGGLLTFINDTVLGNTANTLVLNGGGIQLTGGGVPLNTTLGNGAVTFGRAISVGNSAGSLDTPLNTTAVYFGTGLTAATNGNILTKTGLGVLTITGANTFNGVLALGPNAGTVQLMGQGALNNATGAQVNVGMNSKFVVDNKNSVLNSTGTYVNTNNTNRIGDSVTVELDGGTFLYQAANTAGSIRETLGTVSVNSGSSTFAAQSGGTTGNGGEVLISNLTHTAGSTMSIQSISSNGTVTAYGAAGETGRIYLTQISGVNVTNGQALPGWILGNGADFTKYDTTLGIIQVTHDTSNVTSGSSIAVTGGGQTLNTIQLTGGGSVTFSAGTDVLNLALGGYMSNTTGSIGTAGTRGVLTSGGTLASGTDELDMYISNGTTTVESVIKDTSVAIGSGSAITALMKRQGGTLQLNTTNSYTGGTFVLGGTLTANAVGSLSSGAVTVNGNTTLTLNVAGTGSGGSTFSAINGGQINLANNIAYTNTNDRFSIGAGSQIAGGSASVQGLNSLTRVSSITAGGQIVLATDSMVVTTNLSVNGTVGTGVNTIQGLGTNADVYFAWTGNDLNAGSSQAITIGAGTPWKGIANGDRGTDRHFNQGTITANGDFYLWGPNYAFTGGTQRTLYLGSNSAYTITNASSGNINAYVLGQVTLDGSANLPSTLTFVVQPGGLLTGNRANALGTSGTASSNASIDVLNGGTLAINNVQNAFSGSVTLEAGARFIASQNNSNVGLSGIGTMTFRTGSIIQLDNAAGMAGTQPLSYEPGVIVMQNNNDNPVGISTRFSPDVIWMMRRDSRSITGNGNFTMSGGGVTSDMGNNNLNNSSGTITIGSNGATFSSTTGTVLGIGEDFDLGANTLTIGTNAAIAGVSKANSMVAFVNNGTIRGVAGSQISVIAGYTLRLDGYNQIPDATVVNLPSGSYLFMNTNSNNPFDYETVGALNGTGTVIGYNGNSAIFIGGTNSDSTFAGAFSNTAVNGNGGGNFSVSKVGTANLDLTGVSNDTGTLTVRQGSVRLRDGGKASFGTYTVNNTATLTIDDNIGASANYRLSNGSASTTNTINFNGGSLNLIAGSTAAAEAVGTVTFNQGFTTITLTPNTGSATLTAVTLTAGNHDGVLLRGANLGQNAPGTAGSTNFVITTNPNFQNPGNTQTIQTSGTSMAIRPDIIGDTDPNGFGIGFVTISDVTKGLRLLTAGEYANTIANGVNAYTNVYLTTTPTLTAASSIGSVVFAPGSTGINAGANSLQVHNGAILVQNGVNATITASSLQDDNNNNNNNPYNLFVVGNATLTINAPLTDLHLGITFTKCHSSN